MAEEISADEQSNYETFRDCLSEPVLRALAAPIEKPKARKKRHAKKSSKEKNEDTRKRKDGIATKTTTSTANDEPSDAEDLGEFIEVHYPPVHVHIPLN